jgi:hypothetical protein
MWVMKIQGREHKQTERGNMCIGFLKKIDESVGSI